MVDTAAHLVDRVFPDVPVRQWVLSLPFALRYRLAYDATAASAVLRVFVRAIFESLRRRARDNGIHNTQCGAVTFIQRFGSALNLNVHFHVIVLDGVYACTEEEEKPRFYPLRPPENANVLKVATRVAMRTAALIEGPEQSDHLEREQPGLSALYGASLCGRIATGPNAGQRVKTTGDAIDGERDEVSGSRCVMVSGFSVHAGVGIRAGDRQRLEQLLRYAARPPVAIDRLAQVPDGRLTYRLKTPWRNGTSHVIFETSEFIEKLAALVPAPRANLVRYHGIFGPAAKWRPQIVPSPQKSEPADATCRDAYSVSRPRNYSWAEFMRRVFEIDALKCERCGGRRRIIAAIHPPDTTRKILECLGLPSRAPPVARAASESLFEEL
jgi:hypothetical protein